MATLRERAIEVLGGVTTADLTAARKRAFEAGISEINDEPASGTVASWGYRRVTKKLRDFSDVSHEEMLATAWTLWTSSPIAKRLLTLKRDHIVGQGTKPQTEDEVLGEIFESFWKRNKMAVHLPEFTLQLFLFGEQCYPAFVRESDGQVTVSYLDPKEIDHVISHPQNTLEQWAVVIGEETAGSAPSWSTERPNQIYRIIREDQLVVIPSPDEGEPSVRPAQYEGRLVTADQATLEPWEEKLLAAFGLSEYTGSCFFAKVNSVSNQSRGVSDLLQDADWIDQADETLFSMADREQLAGYFTWIVKLLGSDVDEATVQAKSKEYQANPPSRGGVRVTNEAEDWNFVSPDLKQQGSIEAFRALLGMILGGAGYPFHWFAFGDDANRATAIAQSDPTVKSLIHDQGIVANMLNTMLTFVRDQAIIHSTGVDEEATWMLTMPEIASKDLAQVGTLLAPLTAGLVNQVSQGLLTKETATAILIAVINDLGYEVDLNEELQKLDELAAAGPAPSETALFESYVQTLDFLEDKFRSNGGD